MSACGEYEEQLGKRSMLIVQNVLLTQENNLAGLSVTLTAVHMEMAGQPGAQCQKQPLFCLGYSSQFLAYNESGSGSSYAVVISDTGLHNSLNLVNVTLLKGGKS